MSSVVDNTKKYYVYQESTYDLQKKNFDPQNKV